MKSYRVHIHDHTDQGRWLAQHDFAKRPSREQIVAAMPLLNEPGRYEVVINLVSGGNEYRASSWLEGTPSPPPGTCAACGCNGTDLNSVMEIDHPVDVDADGTVHDGLKNVWAPELLMATDGDGQILDQHEADYADQARRQGWELLTGWTRQHAYRGLVMHPSEYIGGALADHIRETPGTYVAIEVRTDDDDEQPAGWAVAYRPAPEGTETHA